MTLILEEGGLRIHDCNLRIMSMLLAEAASITGSKNADPRSILSFFVNSIYLLV